MKPAHLQRIKIQNILIVIRDDEWRVCLISKFSLGSYGMVVWKYERPIDTEQTTDILRITLVHDWVRGSVNEPVRERVTYRHATYPKNQKLYSIDDTRANFICRNIIFLFFQYKLK